MGTTRGSRVVFGGRPKTSLNQYFPVSFGEDHGWTPGLAGRQTPPASGRRSPISEFGFNPIDKIGLRD